MIRAFALVAALGLAACATPAVPEQPVAPRPQTATVALSSDAEEIAARECGSPVRPETVHHESNAITFRCLREEP